MKTENLVLGLISLSVIAGIGYAVVKKTKKATLANAGGANPGGNPNDTSHSASGISGMSTAAPRMGASLKTASTRNSIFQPAPPAGKVRWVENGVLYEGSKDRKTKKAIGEA